MTRSPSKTLDAELPGESGMPTSGVAVLASPPFVLAVFLLILNDRFFKQALPGWWTGKLSDLAGLFAWSVFWAAMLPGWRRHTYLLTGLVFIVWKSPLSEPLLTAWNATGVWPVGRVIDYTDWLALVVLFPSYRLTRHPFGALRSPTRRWLGYVSGAIAFIAFTATSRIEPPYVFPPEAGFNVAASREQTRQALEDIGLRHAPHWQSRQTAADTVLIAFGARWPQAFWADVELRNATPCGTTLSLLRTTSGLPDGDIEVLKATFVRDVIQPVRTLFPSC